MKPKWIPKDMDWFVAHLIQEFTFSNGDNPLIWVNQILIQADSLELAYSKALQHGELYSDSYENSEGVTVTVRFRGLEELYLIYDKLEDGAELNFSAFEDLTEDQIAAMVKPKELLAAFQAHDPDSPQHEIPLYRLEEDKQ